MPNIIAICIVLHDLCTFNNKKLKVNGLLKKKFGRVCEQKIQEGNEQWGERVELVEVIVKILIRINALITNVINDVERKLFSVNENKKKNDISC